MKRILLVFLTAVLALANSELWAQERTVSGMVTASEDGSGLPGVNVVVKGTTNGTVTDSNGAYKIGVPSGTQFLVFSFIGLKSEEIEIGGRSVIDVSLSLDVTQLSEIVVTAGGLQARTKELGSATTIVSPKILTAGKAVNIAAGLQGKVAGFQINSTSSGVNPEYRLVLRGQRSMTGNNQALIVLDNVIVPSSVLSNLNMNDVESMNILQGAGAAALYGSQASNGAVIITTKRGKAGSVDINVSHNVQITEVAFFPKIQKGFGSGGSGYGIEPDGSGHFNYLENQSYGAPFDGSLRPLGPKLEDGSQLYTTYDYKPGHDDFWQKGVTNQTDFSVSSGTEKSTLFVSGQYVTVTGTTPGDKYNRGNVRVNGTHKVGDKLNVSFSTQYAPNKYDITTATPSIYQNLLNMPSNVDITAMKDWRTNKFANPNGFYNPWYDNPYYSKDANRQEVKNNLLTGNLELKYTPVAGLDLIVREGVSFRNQSAKYHSEGFTYTPYAKQTDQSSKTDDPASVSESTYSTSQSITDFIAQYDKKLNDDLNINVVAGSQLIDRSTRSLGVDAYNLTVKGLYNLSNGTGIPNVYEADYHTRLVGVYGQVTLGFKDYLFLTARGRNDWDSRLAKENRSFFYPSADLSFVLTDAFPNVKNNIINFIKVRGGISNTGQVNLGNDVDLGAYKLLPTFGSTAYGFPFGGLAGFTQNNQLVSSSLEPEITNQFEFGADFTLLSEKVVGTITYYNSRTSNQTITTSLSSTTGFGSLLTNIGETSAKGVELTLHYTPIKTDNWAVTVGGNFTYLQNKVESISGDLNQLNLQQYNNAYSVAKVGQSFPVIMGLDYQRDPQGRIIVDANTGFPLTPNSSNVILGNATPKNRLGLDGQVSWKNLQFSVLFEYRGGYSVYNGIGPELDWSGTGARTAFYNRQGFVFPNSVYMNGEGNYVENTNLVMYNGNGNSGFWSDTPTNRNVTSNYVTSGDFWKLREISLSYDLPLAIVSKTKVLKGVNISVQGRNLFMWMAKDNLYTDPEYGQVDSSNGNGSGLNGLGQTPPVRYYGATLSLKL